MLHEWPVYHKVCKTLRQSVYYLEYSFVLLNQINILSHDLKELTFSRAVFIQQQDLRNSKSGRCFQISFENASSFDGFLLSSGKED